MTEARRELSRKAVHMGMGAFALLLPWLSPWQAAGCAIAAVLFNAFVLHRWTGGALLRPGERERGFSSGILLYPLAVLLLILACNERLEIAGAAWGLLAFGDGMATVAGVTLGGPRLPWHGSKTWAGLLAFIVCGTAASAFLLLWIRPDAFGGAVPALAACFVAAVGSALAESVRTGVDDNLLVPAVGGAVLFAAGMVEPDRLRAASHAIAEGAAWGAALNVAIAALALRLRTVDLSGAVWGCVLGTALCALGGLASFLMLFGFFVLGSAATRAGYARKAALGIAQEKGGRRSARHAWANAGAGVAFAFLAAATAHAAAFRAAVAAAFATAAADTVSSEIGQAYGRRHFLITTFRRVPAGTDGAVSLEGTLAGIAASVVLAAAGWALGLLVGTDVGIIIGAAFIGTTFESVLGATLGRRVALDNEAVNFANTALGGLAAIALRALTG